jgi:hypothetical protein
MGVPSFKIGAEGEMNPLAWESSVSLGSMASFKLRIFLIETYAFVSTKGPRTGARRLRGRRRGIRICLSRSAFPRAAMI